MDQRPPRPAVKTKAQVLQELDSARAELGVHLRHATEEWSPAAVVRRSFERHRWLWMAGGTLAGVLFVRLLSPSAQGKFRRDNSEAPVKKSGLIWQILSPVAPLARQFALKHGLELLQSYLNPPHPPTPEAPPPASSR